MPAEAILLLAPIVAFLFNVILHILICNMFGGGQIIRALGFSYVFGAAALMAIEGFLFRHFAFDVWNAVANLLIYTSLVYTYFHFNNMLRTARRVRLVLELYNSNGLTHEELATLYPAEEILNNRIRRLTATGQLMQKADVLYINGKFFLLVARIINSIKRILG